MVDSTEELDLNSVRIDISRNDLALFMGYEDQPVPLPVETAFDEFFNDFPSHFKPRAGFRICGAVMPSADGFSCGDTFFHTSRIIAGNLKHSDCAAFFAATVGPEFDSWSRRSMTEGDGLLGYVVDCAGSILAERLADKVEMRIGAYAAECGYSVSTRYSPGYCDWNVVEQKKLFSFLPPGFCGISLTESALMMPIKSVSGMIGIGRGVRKREYQCSVCTQERCIMARFRKRTAV